jgi:ABC-type transport system involved in multi-copper enzyme maturation permease subunit
VNPTLILALAQQRARSLPRMALVFSFFSLPLLVLLFARQAGLVPLHTGSAYAIFMSAGLVGQDVSSGTLQLLLARPVTRAEYVVSRWLGAVLIATGLLVAQLVLGVALLGLRGELPGGKELVLFAGGQVLDIVGTTSVLLLFSTMLPGIGDFLAVIVATLTGQALQLGGTLFKAAWLVRAGVEVGRFVAPALDLGRLFGGGPVSWFEVVSYFSTVTLCVALAIVVMTRRELSYATE